MLTDIQRTFIEAAARTIWHCPNSCDCQGIACRGSIDNDANAVAAILLGKIEHANGCGIETIIEAAWNADMNSTLPASIRRSIGPYSREFASAVAMEALGVEGTKWADAHAEVRIPARRGETANECGKCRHSAPHDRTQPHDNGATPGFCSFAYGEETYCGCLGLGLYARLLIVPRIDLGTAVTT